MLDWRGFWTGWRYIAVLACVLMRLSSYRTRHSIARRWTRIRGLSFVRLAVRGYLHPMVIIRGHRFRVVRVRQLLDFSLLCDVLRQICIRKVLIAIVRVFMSLRRDLISNLKCSDLSREGIDFLQGRFSRAIRPIGRRDIWAWSFCTDILACLTILGQYPFRSSGLSAVIEVRRYQIICRRQQYRRFIVHRCKEAW